MRPDDPNNGRVGTPLTPQRSLQPNPTDHTRDQSTAAVANIARHQLDQIYSGHTDTPTPQTTPVATQQTPSTEPDNPYARHQHNPTHIQANEWQQYHSAWQDYYQKYYERYYVGQVYHAQKALMARAEQASTTNTPTETISEPASMDRDEAMYDLRSKLRGKIKTSASRVRKSRHFIPITAGICVLLIFLFLQYNRVLFGAITAYVSPGNVDPANIVIDPTTTASVGAEPKLIIPKINVDVPVVYDTLPDYKSQMQAMEGGVAYFGIPGANSKPGQVGNTVISGHSSNDITDKGDYKFIFARLEKLARGDSIVVNYESKRYIYTVTKTEVVKPNQVDKLVYPTTKPVLTLITCTPLGTALNRLLVTAEQISPDPSSASAAPESAPTTTTSIPGSQSSFIENIFGGGR